MKKSLYVLLMITYTAVWHGACIPNNNPPTPLVISNTIDSTIIGECVSLSNTWIEDVQVPDAAIAGEAFPIVANIVFRDGCGFYAGASITKLGRHYYYNIATGNRRCQLCTDALVPYTHNYTLSIQNPGTYQLHFAKDDGTEIVKTITIQ